MEKIYTTVTLKCMVLLIILFFTSQIFAAECGDVNSDGEIDIVDALLIAQDYVNLDPENYDSTVADVNADNEIDIVDALLVAQYYVDLISELNCGETHTPIPTNTSETYELQAEDAAWDEGTVDTNYSGYTGSGFVNTANSRGRWIEWSINVVSATDAICVFTYTNASGNDRSMDLSVNGNVISSVSFPDTNAWDTWSTETATVSLDAGLNAIRLTATNDMGAPNMDKMDITTGPIVTQEPTLTPDPTTPGPTQNPDEWASIRTFRDLKYGMFIHYSLSTFDGKEQTPGNTTSVNIYNPTDLDVDQWIQVARDAGMKYAVLTAKHSSGFCLWDSKVQWNGSEFAYDVGASPVKTDVVAEFMTACDKYDIMPGIYYCTMDTRHSDSTIKWTPSLPYVSQEYFQLMQDHLTELHTNYPDIKIQWIDIPRHLTSGERTTLYNLVKNINPECLVMYNYGQESRDVSTYTIAVAKKVTWPTDILNSEITPIDNPFQVQQEDNGKTYELAYEHCISITDKWFWKSNESLKSASNLISIKNQTWNLNGNFLLNVPPDKTGHIPDATIQRLNDIK